MGVHGLWKLIEPSGQMVPLESLAGKVLAVDVSIWLHQAVKGMHDAHGAPLAVAHLLVLFHRVCKLLFYKIKPVFVFDGGVPALKRQTMTARRQRSNVAKSEVLKVREKLIKNLLKHEAVRHMLSDEAASAALGLNSFTLPGPSVEEDLYKLPPIAADCVDSESSDALNSSDSEDSEKHAEDIHSIDVTSQEFLSLPAEVRHDILTELIETRKQSSWKHLDSMPKKSDSFSDFQMSRLLKRHAVQTSLEKAGKEMGGRALSLKELESLLGDQGVLDPKIDLPSKRIAQDSITRYMLIQKDSECTQEEKEEKKFDIMNHLEDVEWSSESDTDVILQKPPRREKEISQTNPSTNTGRPVEKRNYKAQEKSTDSSISNRPKVRMTQEVADILSILEDKDAAMDVKVKVENLQTKINFNKNSIVSRVVKLETSAEAKDNEISDLKKELKPEFPEVLGISQSEVSHVAIPIKAPDFENEICEEKTEKKAPEIKDTDVKEKETEVKRKGQLEVSHAAIPGSVPDFENGVFEEKIAEKKASEIKETGVVVNEVERLPETAPSASADTIEETADSASDSESDFIPITTEEAESVSAVAREENSTRSEAPKNSDPLIVVINPSEAGGKDDLFADVFEPVSQKSSDANPNEMTEVENVETETGNGSESIKEVDEEFREQLLAGDLSELKKTLEEQHSDFLKEKGKQERLALNMTDQIYTDAQELLRLFGIPFVVAPMEAEAQCATLNTIGLTEGTITDDSDIWLFGGQVVYKNFFNQQKHVLEYKSETIQKYFKLTREEMIKMALLVGSDYTVGLSGIGPVTALEIMAAFQNPNHGLLDCLLKFRDWFTGAATGGPPRITLRKKIKNTVITPGFPNRAVVEAYLHPQVDDSKEPFSWSKPNIDLIRKYVRAKLGWSTDKCNEFLLPVVKKLGENTSQSTIDKHFKLVQKTSAPDGMLSKRVENAIKRLGGDAVDSEEPVKDVKPRKKRKPNNQVEDRSENEEKAEGNSKSTSKASPSCNTEFNTSFRNSSQTETSKIKLINEKLHRNVKVPQKEMAQKLLEEKKKEAVRIFRTYKKGGKKKTKVYAKEQVKLSESSSDDD